MVDTVCVNRDGVPRWEGRASDQDIEAGLLVDLFVLMLIVRGYDGMDKILCNVGPNRRGV